MWVVVRGSWGVRVWGSGVGGGVGVSGVQHYVVAGEGGDRGGWVLSQCAPFEKCPDISKSFVIYS